MSTLPSPPADKTVKPALQFLIDNYVPASGYLEASMRISTHELYDKLQEQFPSPELTPALILDWMNDLGYKYQDSGNMRAEWLLKKLY